MNKNWFCLFAFFTFACCAPLLDAAKVRPPIPEKRGEYLEEGRELAYPHSIQAWTCHNYDKASYRNAVDDLKQLARKTVKKKEFYAFVDSLATCIPNGCCYGEAMTFMLCNPPSQKEIHFLQQAQDKRSIVFFQSHECLKGPLFAKSDKFLEACYSYLAAYHPELGEIFDLADPAVRRVLEKDELNLAKFSRKRAAKFEQMVKLVEDFLQTYEFYELLEEEHEAILAKKGVVMLDLMEEEESLSELSQDDLYSYLKSTLTRLIIEQAPSDIMLGINLPLHELENAGHALLVQVDHCRIYDAAYGIYQYENISDLIEDISRLIAHGVESDSIEIIAFRGP